MESLESLRRSLGRKGLSKLDIIMPLYQRKTTSLRHLRYNDRVTDLKAVTSELKATTSDLKVVTLDLKVVTWDLKVVTLDLKVVDVTLTHEPWRS